MSAPFDLERQAMLAARAFFRGAGVVIDDDEHTLGDVPSHPDEYGFIEVRDLVNAPADLRPWAIEGVLRAPGSMLLGGDPKIGKSTLARVLGFATVAETPFLGRQVRGGPVLWIAADGEAEQGFRDHAEALLRSFTPQHDFKRIPLGRTPELPKRVAWLKEAAASLRAVLVIIDNPVNFFELGDQDCKYGVIAKATTPLLEAIQELEIALVMLTHTSNGGKTIYGGSGWLRVADINVLYAQGRGGVRYLESVLSGRGDSTWESTAIGYDRATKAVFVAPSPREDAIRLGEQNILSSGAVGTREEVAGAAKVDIVLGRLALDNLVEAGLYVVTKVGRKQLFSPPGQRPPSLAVVPSASELNLASNYIETNLIELDRSSIESPSNFNRGSNGVPSEILDDDGGRLLDE